MITATHAHTKIPLDTGQVQGWKNIPIIKGTRPDPLVPLGSSSKEAAILMTSSVYFGEHSNSPYATDNNKLAGSLLTIFARRSVARRLVAAEKLLPVGHHLILFDAYRPYQVQKSLYDFYKRKLSEKHPDMGDEELDAETQKYVSFPSTDPTKPSPHNTGGAVDVSIVKLEPAHEQDLQQIRSHLADTRLDFTTRIGLEKRISAIMRHAKMLDFGTAFDHGGEKSALAYYESKLAAGETLTYGDTVACNSRRLLFKVMTQAGFQPYASEWWHFNAPESQMGAAAAGLDYATFVAMTLDDRNMAHEHERLEVRQEALRLHEEGDAFDDPRIGGDWPTEIIAPPKE